MKPGLFEDTESTSRGCPIEYEHQDHGERKRNFCRNRFKMVLPTDCHRVDTTAMNSPYHRFPVLKIFVKGGSSGYRSVTTNTRGYRWPSDHRQPLSRTQELWCTAKGGQEGGTANVENEIVGNDLEMLSKKLPPCRLECRSGFAVLVEETISRENRGDAVLCTARKRSMSNQEGAICTLSRQTFVKLLKRLRLDSVTEDTKLEGGRLKNTVISEHAKLYLNVMMFQVDTIRGYEWKMCRTSLEEDILSPAT